MVRNQADEERGNRSFLIMGAGEVGSYLARVLSQQGHSVTVVDLDAGRLERLEEQLDLETLRGNAAHVAVLEEAGAAEASLFLAVTSDDQANLAASLLAKHLGAGRTVVRLGSAHQVISHAQLYYDLFKVDLLLSTQVLMMDQILNPLLGHTSLEVEYLAGGRLQLRKVFLPEGSPVVGRPVADLEPPKCCRVLGVFRGEELVLADGDLELRAGDVTLALAEARSADDFERRLTGLEKTAGPVVVAGAGATAQAVVEALRRSAVPVRAVEPDRLRAGELAERFPGLEVLHGDFTDPSFLRAEGVERASAFVAVSRNEAANLLACLLAEELGVALLVAEVERTETSRLWKEMGSIRVLSPRVLAAQRIQDYVAGGYSSHIVSLRRGAVQVMERRLAAASPAAGVTMRELSPPPGVIVAAVVRDEEVILPGPEERLEVEDLVVLVVREAELDLVRLLFPGPEEP